MCDDVYHQFVQSVAEQRGLDITQEKNWADGKIFTGKQALALRLIDEIGTQETARKKLKELTHSSDDVILLTPPQPSMFERLLKSPFSTLSKALVDSIQKAGASLSVMHTPM